MPSSWERQEVDLQAYLQVLLFLSSFPAWHIINYLGRMNAVCNTIGCCAFGLFDASRKPQVATQWETNPWGAETRHCFSCICRPSSSAAVNVTVELNVSKRPGKNPYTSYTSSYILYFQSFDIPHLSRNCIIE